MAGYGSDFALSAGPDTGEHRDRRWIARVTPGSVHNTFGLASAALAALCCSPSERVIAAVAGLALLGTFAASMHAALAVASDRMPAVVTYAVAASGLAIAGVSAAFWALVAGVMVRLVLHAGHR